MEMNVEKTKVMRNECGKNKSNEKRMWKKQK
jgi:hypothetical protein